MFLGLLLITFTAVQVVIVAQGHYDRGFEVAPNYNCIGREVAEMDAYIDLQKEPTQRNGNFHCFCKNLIKNGDWEAANAFTFESDPEASCQPWLDGN